ncbi:hypothetical protein BC834DRAFT_977143 [Gloeopeniophorella convolvens]|nr:hypothetical protein BC834DRAFT_977143 [Gloeopeniophorella convolvens]
MAGDRLDLFRRMHYSTFLAGLRGGHVYVATYDGVPAGIAGWFPPGAAILGKPEQSKGGFDELFADFDEPLRKWWLEYFIPKFDAQTRQALGVLRRTVSWRL